MELTLEELGQAVHDLAAMVGNPNHGDETFRAYLRFAARLHKYSARNLLLIMWQCPEASYIASYRTWESLGRAVIRGETGIAIIRPQRKLRKRMDGGGRVEWRVGYVFDSGQTVVDGPIENYKPHLEAEVGNLLAAAYNFAAHNDIAVTQEPMLGHVNGKSKGGSIVLNANRSETIQVQTALHEIAHEFLHPLEERANLTVQQAEIEAESVATIVLQAFGFETLSSSAAYIRQHTRDPKQILACLDRIRSTAHFMIEGIQRELAVLSGQPLAAVSIQ